MKKTLLGLTAILCFGIMTFTSCDKEICRQCTYILPASGELQESELKCDTRSVVNDWEESFKAEVNGNLPDVEVTCKNQ